MESKATHKHIKFHEGHITWTGENDPSPEVIEAFEKLYQFVWDNQKAIDNLRITKAERPAIYGPPPTSPFSYPEIDPTKFIKKP